MYFFSLIYIYVYLVLYFALLVVQTFLYHVNDLSASILGLTRASLNGIVAFKIASGPGHRGSN